MTCVWGVLWLTCTVIFLKAFVYLVQTRGNQHGCWTVLPASKGHCFFRFNLLADALREEGWVPQWLEHCSCGRAQGAKAAYITSASLTHEVLSSGIIQWAFGSLPTPPKMHPTATRLCHFQRDFIPIISCRLQTPSSANWVAGNFYSTPYSVSWNRESNDLSLFLANCS